MSKKRIPFDITKMNKDFSNVVYRDGTRPQFVCARSNGASYPITSVDEDGDPECHTSLGQTIVNPEKEDPKDLLLEVEQSYPSLDELSEE